MARVVVDAPWYVSNQTLHTDLKILLIKDEIQRIATKYNRHIVDHETGLIEQLYNDDPDVRRLRTTWPEDLLDL